MLITVVAAVLAFTEQHKNAWVYATGSSKSRTRLYRMGIAKFLSEANEQFWVFGLINGEWKSFKKDEDYSAFVVRRK